MEKWRPLRTREVRNILGSVRHGCECYVSILSMSRHVRSVRGCIKIFMGADDTDAFALGSSWTVREGTCMWGVKADWCCLAV